MSRYTEEEMAGIEADRTAEIDRLRDVLGVALREAQSNLNTALRTVSQLVSGGIYDVEYAESVYSTDLETLLDKAVRAVRIATLVKKKLDS